MTQTIGYYISQISVILSGLAVKYGKAGVTQAFVNLSSVWMTIIVFLLYDRFPTYLQTAGLICGLAGAAITGLAKK